MRTFTLLLILMLGSATIYAQQDTLIKRNNERIVCKVKEIGTDEIKYLLPGNDVVMVIDKNEVRRVILASGTTMNLSNSMTDTSSYSDQRKNCLKFRLISPLIGYSEIIYERSLKPGASLEFGLGIVGAGEQYNQSQSGASMRIGYKFIKTPDFYLKGMRYAHVLKGAYFRPEVAASYYKRDFKEVFATAILFSIGNQWIFNNLIAVDIFGGIGYGYSSRNVYDYQFGYSTGASNFPVALSTGFR
ncbi:MAG TPA: hypothetical protein VMV56_00710, partial [Williamwhitmania sp.]|nr:hypothetical protein [Williamwhitmania sp.]